MHERGLMMNKRFYTKEERGLIEFLNENLGTNHRSNPYDFYNKKDMKEQLELMIGRYMDYRKYWKIMETL